MSGTIYTSGGLRRIAVLGARAKLGLASFLLVVALGGGLASWITTSAWKQLGQLEQEFAAIQTESFYLGITLREGILRLNGGLLRFQLSQDPDERDRFHQEARELKERITSTKTHLVTPREQAQVSAVEAAFDQYLAATAPLLEKGLRAIRKDSAAQMHAAILEHSRSLQELCDNLVAAQQAALDRVFDHSQNTLLFLKRLAVASLLALLLLVFLLALLAYRALITPLRARLDESQALIERQEKLASLGVLATGVAHEIRNPLTAIKFRLFSLKKTLPAALAQNEDVGVINSEIDRLEKIVKDFLQFARPSEPEWDTVPAQHLLQEVRDLLQSQLEKQDIELRLEPAEAVWLRADKHQLAQVLINLVQNAADSIGTGGTITLSARPGMGRLANGAGPVVLLDVADTGKGIPPEAEKRIFDPFFSTKEGGTGLGLSIAARIVEKHGGFIQYASQLNRGTTFSIVLPRLPHHASPDTAH